MNGRYPGAVCYLRTRSDNPLLVLGIKDRVGALSHTREEVSFFYDAAADSSLDAVCIFEAKENEIDTVGAKVMGKYLGANIGSLRRLRAMDMAIFRRTGPEFTSSRSSAGPVRGVLTIEAMCTDPAREEQFNEWYDTRHVPDMFSTGLYHAAYRYEIVSRQEGRGHYLAIYETDKDPKLAQQTFWTKFRPEWLQSGRVIETMRVLLAKSYVAVA